MRSGKNFVNKLVPSKKKIHYCHSHINQCLIKAPNQMGVEKWVGKMLTTTPTLFDLIFPNWASPVTTYSRITDCSSACHFHNETIFLPNISLVIL